LLHGHPGRTIGHIGRIVHAPGDAGQEAAFFFQPATHIRAREGCEHGHTHGIQLAIPDEFPGLLKDRRGIVIKAKDKQPHHADAMGVEFANNFPGLGSLAVALAAKFLLVGGVYGFKADQHLATTGRPGLI